MTGSTARECPSTYRKGESKHKHSLHCKLKFNGTVSHCVMLFVAVAELYYSIDNLPVESLKVCMYVPTYLCDFSYIMLYKLLCFYAYISIPIFSLRQARISPLMCHALNKTYFPFDVLCS